MLGSLLLFFSVCAVFEEKREEMDNRHNVPARFLCSPSNRSFLVSLIRSSLSAHANFRLPPPRLPKEKKRPNPEIRDISSSSSSCHAISTDIPDPFSPPFSIIHCFWQVFKGKSRICKELLYVGSSWSSCLCSSLWRDSQEYVTYWFVSSVPHVWFV